MWPWSYEAVVVGNLREDCGTVDAPIGRRHTDRKKMAVTDRGGKNAVTHWEALEHFPGYTHVRCKRETGRTHQIRVHMAHIGHPIYGDTVYGAGKPVPGLTGQCFQAVSYFPCFSRSRRRTASNSASSGQLSCMASPVLGCVNRSPTA